MQVLCGLQGIFLLFNCQTPVESTDGSFEPYEVHYGETFIVPAKLEKYRITPLENKEGKIVGVIQAYVR